MRKTFLIIVLIFFLGCTHNYKTIDIDTLVLSPLKKIEQINDSTFLSLVLNITESNGFVYFSDSKYNRIVCVDSNYKLVHCFGSSGRGPSEFNFAGGTIVNNNKLYAIDEENKRINIFDLTGKYIGNIKGIIPSMGRFILNDSVYFGNTMTRDAPPIFKAQINGELIKQFGNQERILKNVNEHTPKNYFLETCRDQMIAICVTDPVIERYTSDGEFLNSFDYSNLAYVVQYIAYCKYKDEHDKQSGSLRGTHSFCSNSYIKGNRLYLGLAGFDNVKNKVEANHILVLDVGGKTIKPVKMLELRNDNGKDLWYYAFCIAGDKLIAFDCNSYEIHEFNINF